VRVCNNLCGFAVLLRVCLAALVLSICFSAESAFGQDKINVAITVNAPQQAQDRVLSALRRHLREFGDVEIVSDFSTADAWIGIVGVESRSQVGNELWGYAFATVFVTCFQPGCNYYDTHIVNNVSTDGLEEFARSMVATLDVETLEWLRSNRLGQ
jgi:hypothetical protein